ncbi:unnamed protein product [Trichobilharzia szidati]|nr:unnamed protein product [Trichobilharzia szidati]
MIQKKESLLWPVTGYTFMICVSNELTHKQSLLELLKCSLYKLTGNNEYKFNVALTGVTTTNDHSSLSEDENSEIKKLIRLSQITFGTFAVIRICSTVKTCTSGCTTWLMDIKRSSSHHTTTSKRSQKIQIHMLLYNEPSRHVILPCGKVYQLNDSKEHERVLMKPTLTASLEFANTYFGSHSFSNFDCCSYPNLWSRVSVNKKLVDDLNRRIYESAKDEASSKKCLSDWSANKSSHILDMMNNREVLARRSKDGHYYLGSIQSVKSHSPVDEVLVRFGPIKCLTNSSLLKSKSAGLDSDIFYYEWIDITDIIDLKHARKHPVEPGSCVLIPQTWPLPKCPNSNKTKPTNLKNLRYYAAVVVSSCSEQQHECDKLKEINKNADKADEDVDRKLLVELASCNTRAGYTYVSEKQAIWIPYNTYQRIVLEQYMSPESRKWLKNKTFLPNSYPIYSAPGYPADGFAKFLSNTGNPLIQPLTFQHFKRGMDVQFEYCPNLQCMPLYSVVNDLLPTVNDCPVWMGNSTENKKLNRPPKMVTYRDNEELGEDEVVNDTQVDLVYRSRNIKPVK